jgi:predicted metal-binding membrane protein
VLLSGGLFIGAGIYQFSALKQACLTQCQRPFPFFFANWTAEPRGVFRLGLRQGAYCLGCCWAMMLLTFAVGAMNVVWMAALGMLMTMEKMTVTARMTRVIGIGFIMFGAGLIASRLV